MIVERGNRSHLGGCAGQEHLVGEVQLGARQIVFDRLDADGGSHLHHRVARNAGETGGADRRGVQLAVHHREDVLARAVSNQTSLVEEDRLVVAVLERLHLRELRVEVLAGGLGGGRNHVRADAAPGRDHAANAVLNRLVAEVGPPLPNRDHGVNRAVERVDTHLASAAENQRADVAGRQLVDLDRLVHSSSERLGRIGDFHVVLRSRALEPIQVVGQVKDARALIRLVRADALENARAVVQRVREDVNLRIGVIDEFSVEPNLVGLHGVVSLGRERIVSSPPGTPRIYCPIRSSTLLWGQAPKQSWL